MSEEQRTKGIVLHAMRRAVLDLWGEDGLADVAKRVSADTRVQTLEVAASPLVWVPARFLVEWHEATWSGPGQRDDAALCRTVDRRIDFGFGRVRKAMLGLVGPEEVIRRAGELWRHDHTHGTLAMTFEKGSKKAIATLSDSLFCESPIARLALMETIRYIVQLSRGVSTARATQAMQGKSVLVNLSWQ